MGVLSRWEREAALRGILRGWDTRREKGTGQRFWMQGKVSLQRKTEERKKCDWQSPFGIGEKKSRSEKLGDLMKSCVEGFCLIREKGSKRQRGAS